MARIPLVSPETLTPGQRRIYDAVVAGPRGAVVGPLRAALHSPELADRWQRLGEFLRYHTSLPPRLNELAILVTARRWNSQVEFYIHAKAARNAGLPELVIEAIRLAQPPAFDDADDADIYEYARALQETGQVPEPLYERIAARWGAVGIVEITAVIGYYTMVSMTLNVHEIPLPDDASPPLSSGAGLTALPPAQETK